MGRLTIGNFVRSGEPGSFRHLFTYKLKTGGEICLESCLNGYDVAIYDKNLQIIGKKVCTNVEGMVESQIMPGFSMGTGKALQKAVAIANKLVKKHGVKA